ncbi:MAG: hypothetical protein CfP315_0680 [Candidatus Improbicoccus pseudotrichonymphae]|uniref:Lipoprotein n=1 Tax=Candidatus Improbicoccus pseudotrichonymphae TaxID=3033792 RepID=A0AA48KVM8_9FIRM|nr:MAG: hypothetical protein CfP315_0680 [Candidatus Improbicoccus pseudotrichonymphae]
MNKNKRMRLVSLVLSSILFLNCSASGMNKIKKRGGQVCAQNKERNYGQSMTKREEEKVGEEKVGRENFYSKFSDVFIDFSVFASACVILGYSVNNKYGRNDNDNDLLQSLDDFNRCFGNFRELEFENNFFQAGSGLTFPGHISENWEGFERFLNENALFFGEARYVFNLSSDKKVFTFSDAIRKRHRTLNPEEEEKLFEFFGLVEWFVKNIDKIREKKREPLTTDTLDAKEFFLSNFAAVRQTLSLSVADGHSFFAIFFPDENKKKYFLKIFPETLKGKRFLRLELSVDEAGAHVTIANFRPEIERFGKNSYGNYTVNVKKIFEILGDDLKKAKAEVKDNFDDKFSEFVDLFNNKDIGVYFEFGTNGGVFRDKKGFKDLKGMGIDFVYGGGCPREIFKALESFSENIKGYVGNEQRGIELYADDKFRNYKKTSEYLKYVNSLKNGNKLVMGGKIDQSLINPVGYWFSYYFGSLSIDDEIENDTKIYEKMGKENYPIGREFIDKIFGNGAFGTIRSFLINNRNKGILDLLSYFGNIDILKKGDFSKSTSIDSCLVLALLRFYMRCFLGEEKVCKALWLDPGISSCFTEDREMTKILGKTVEKIQEFSKHIAKEFFIVETAENDEKVEEKRILRAGRISASLLAAFFKMYGLGEIK